MVTMYVEPDLSAQTFTLANGMTLRLRTLLVRSGTVALVVAVHVLALTWFADRTPEPLPVVTPRTIYATVITEPAPAPAAVSEPPAPVAAVQPIEQPAPEIVPPVVPVHAITHPKPVSRPRVAQHRTAPAPQPVAPSVPAPVVAAAPTPAATPAPAPAPTPKTVTRGVEYLRAPQPEYPDTARAEGDEGTVVLRVLVDEHGKPSSVDVLRSSGFTSLDNAGRTAALGAMFRPYMDSGHAVAVYVIVPLKFQLDS